MININNVLKEDYIKWYNKEFIYQKKDHQYYAITYGQFIEHVITLSNYLLNKKLKDARIIIYGENSIEWMISDVALLSYVGVSVCVSKEASTNDLENIINQLDIKGIIYSPKKKSVIKNINTNNLFTLCMDEFETIFALEKDGECLFDLPTKDHECCSKIVFSSGTTSKPKPVMLSLKNIFAGYNSLQKRVNLNEEDICYLFLPLYHTYGGIYNFIYALKSGFKIYLAEDMNNIIKEILEINPTIISGVPLIYRRIYEADPKHFFNFFGTRIKYLFTGGAKIDEMIRKAYLNNGLCLLNAYALSETASSFSIQYPTDNTLEDVGTIFEDIEVYIDNPDKKGVGEIVVKGDNVFLGYADKSLDNRIKDGYFYTDDCGYITNNKLYLVGRKPKQITLENGINIDSTFIEDRICHLHSNITCVKIYLRDTKLFCDIYIKEPIEGLESLIEEYNDKVSKYEKVKNYQIIIDSIDTRLKQ